MNRNDFLFRKESKELVTTTLKVDGKNKIFSFDNVKKNQFKFNCFSTMDNNLILFDIVNYKEADFNETYPLSFDDDLFIFDDYKIFHLEENGQVCLDPLVLDATLIDETKYKLISEITDYNEIEELRLNLKTQDKKSNNNCGTTEHEKEKSVKVTEDKRNQSSLFERYSIPFIILVVIVLCIIYLISGIIIYKLYNARHVHISDSKI